MMTKITTEMRALKVVSKANSYKEIKKDIGWFASIARDRVLDKAEVRQALQDLEIFLEEKELEKAEVMAELQMGEALQNKLKARLFEEV